MVNVVNNDGYAESDRKIIELAKPFNYSGMDLTEPAPGTYTHSIVYKGQRENLSRGVP